MAIESSRSPILLAFQRIAAHMRVGEAGGQRSPRRSNGQRESGGHLSRKGPGLKSSFAQITRQPYSRGRLMTPLRQKDGQGVRSGLRIEKYPFEPVFRIRPWRISHRAITLKPHHPDPTMQKSIFSNLPAEDSAEFPRPDHRQTAASS